MIETVGGMTPQDALVKALRAVLADAFTGLTVAPAGYPDADLLALVPADAREALLGIDGADVVSPGGKAAVVDSADAAAEPPGEHLHYCSRCRRRGRKEGAREAKREAVGILVGLAAQHQGDPSDLCWCEWNALMKPEEHHPACKSARQYIAAADADAAEEGKP